MAYLIVAAIALAVLAGFFFFRRKDKSSNTAKTNRNLFNELLPEDIGILLVTPRGTPDTPIVLRFRNMSNDKPYIENMIQAGTNNDFIFLDKFISKSEDGKWWMDETCKAFNDTDDLIDFLVESNPKAAHYVAEALI